MIEGQPLAIAALQALVGGKSSSSLILEGDEGVGKRSATLEAISGVGSASDQKLIREGAHPDVHFLSDVGGKEIGIDDVRELVLNASLFPTSLPYRFFVVDGVDKLSTAAANALLKPLEERAGKSRFILLTTSYRGVIKAIRSRCTRVYCSLLSDDLIESKIALFETDGVKARAYTRLACGSVGRAISLWQSNGLSFRDKVFNLFQLLPQGDIPGIFAGLDVLTKQDELFLRVGTSIASDLVVPAISHRNTDISEEISVLASTLGVRRVEVLWEKWRKLVSDYQTSHINLLFQSKVVFL